MVWPSRPIIKLLRAEMKVKDNQISVFVLVLSYYIYTYYIIPRRPNLQKNPLIKILDY